MSIDEKATEYFSIEARRRNLAQVKNFRDLRETYNLNINIPDFNSGVFWDSKFDSPKEHEIAKRNPMEKERNETALKWFCELPLRRTLNIGCGDGNFEKLIFESKLEVKHDAIDMAKKTISVLKRKYPVMNFFVKDALKDDLGKKVYSVVTLFEVLEHISPRDTFKLLRKINGALQQSGFFMISVPMNEGLEEMYPNNPNAHLRCYSKELIFAELQISGFTPIKYKEFYAFNKNYGLKTFLAQHIFKSRWKPNNILILAQKA